MSAMASQITGIPSVYLTVCSGEDQRKHQAPCHWPLWGEFTGDRWIPPQRAGNAENVSIWWRHHVPCPSFALSQGLWLSMWSKCYISNHCLYSDLIVQAKNKTTLKLSITGPFWYELTNYRWIPPAKGKIKCALRRGEHVVCISLHRYHLFYSFC